MYKREKGDPIVKLVHNLQWIPAWGGGGVGREEHSRFQVTGFLGLKLNFFDF